MEQARNVNHVHNKNIEDMLNIKVEIGSKRGKTKREKKTGGYIKKIQKSSATRPQTQLGYQNPAISKVGTAYKPPSEAARCQTANNFYKSDIFSNT